MEAKNAEALATLKETEVDIRSFPEEVIEQLRIHTEEVIAELTANDPFARKTYQSYESFRLKMADYSLITEKRFYDLIQGNTSLKLG
jgi:TRAP-type mannitol/chloroaromatic compound transport system substrate-binding protein